jgi:hypothetical protein
MSATTLTLSRIGQSDPVCIEDWTQTTANLPAFFNLAPLVAALDGPVSQHDSNQKLLLVPMGNHHGNFRRKSSTSELWQLCPVSALNGLALSSHHRQKFLAKKGRQVAAKYVKEGGTSTVRVNWTG